MASSSERAFLSLISGQRRGILASLARMGLVPLSFLYSGIIRLRNRLFDAGVGVKRLPRPVISIGNLTTGGTGKTPVVCWLCRHLRHLGYRPAILLRGYKARAGERSDEQAMLQSLLADLADPPVIVHADPDRVRGGIDVLGRDPGVDVFLLDDGFQHRRLAREFDLVLIDALNPFGYGHVLPRGLLREPVSGLSRASAVLITHADQVEADTLNGLIHRITESAPDAGVYCGSHRHHALRMGGDCVPLATLADRRYLAFAGIGHPEALAQQLAALPGAVVATRWFADHHAYTPADLESLATAARDASADLLLTTEKDWVKVGPLVPIEFSIPVVRLDLALGFADSDELELLSDIKQVLPAR